MDQDLFQQQMDLLQIEYGAGLDERFAGMKQVISGIDTTNYEEDMMGELYRQIHSLTGSAATFGYVRLSRMSEILEAELRQFIQSSTPLSEKQVKQILESIDQLQAVAKLGVDELPQSQPLENASPSSQQINKDCMLYVVEDDPQIGQEIVAQLNSMGYRTQLFNDSTSACASIKTRTPDAMLVDVMLPEGALGGTELVGSMEDIIQQVPVIFISSRGDWDARLAAVRAGGKAYLTKPINFTELFTLLDRLVKNSESEPFRVLIVDDEKALAEHYALVLRNAGMLVDTLNDPTQILKAMSDFKPELLVLDLYMPIVSGMEVANVIRQYKDLLGIPIVFLSAEQDRSTQLQALQNGDDFLQKPISDNHLLAAITSRVKRARSLNTLMYRDGLTGLLNHSALFTQLEDEINRCRRLKQNLCYVMLDLDHFKKVNDRYGHGAGDRVLKGLSRLLKGRLRKTDKVGRYGGEEFGIILPDTSETVVFKIIDDLRKHFAKLTYSAHNEYFHCTFSAGIAQLTPQDDASQLSERADKMLYQAKHDGRNKVVMSQV